MLALIVGFLMATLGVALLCFGEVPLGPGKKIPARSSRVIGVVLMSFLPLALALRHLVNAMLGSDAVDTHVLNWSLFGVVWLVVILILARLLLKGRRAKKKTAAAAKPAAMPEAIEVHSVDVEPIEGPGFGEAQPDAFLWTDAEPAPQQRPKKAPPGAAKKPSQKPAKPENNPFDFG